MAEDEYPRILIVDDESEMRELMKEMLFSLKYSDYTYGSIREVADGNSAIEKLIKENFDLAIIDWKMPRMSGLELLDFIRNNEKLHNLPVLMVTGLNDADAVAEAITHQVTGYLVKPFNKAGFEKQVGRILSDSEAGS